MVGRGCDPVCCTLRKIQQSSQGSQESKLMVTGVPLRSCKNRPDLISLSHSLMTDREYPGGVWPQQDAGKAVTAQHLGLWSGQIPTAEGL